MEYPTKVQQQQEEQQQMAVTFLTPQRDGDARTNGDRGRMECTTGNKWRLQSAVYVAMPTKSHWRGEKGELSATALSRDCGED